MAICVHFVPVSMNVAQYDEAVKLIAEAGQGAPAGRRYHVCFGTGNNLQVFDIWDSRNEWDTFSQTVMGVSQKLGVEVSQVTIEPVHNIIVG